MRWVLLTALGLWGVSPASAKKPKPAPAPTLSVQQQGVLFAEVAEAIASGNRQEAGRLLVGIVEDDSKAAAHGQAWAMLADTLAGLDLPIASMIAWGKGYTLDPSLSADKLPAMLERAEAQQETLPVGRALAAHLATEVSDELKNRVVYTAARHHVHQGNYGAAIGALMLGDANAPRFEDIELLRGVVLSLQGKTQDAIPPMLIAEAMGRQNGRDARFVNRANVNLARAHYAVENYTQAILFYAKVERSSDFWLDAQFERAWAHFRGNDTNGALAMLFTHQTPFFEVDYYNPEADLLRAYALFIMCKFPDATAQIDTFQAKWEPIRDAYAGVAMNPEEAFQDVGAYLDGREPALPIALLRPFQQEDRMQDAVAFADRARKEMARADGLGDDVGRLASSLVEGLREERIAMEGQRILDRVATARGELDSLLTDIEITRLDLLNLESEMYARAAATGDLDYGDNIGQLRELKKRKGYRVWPFQGEYWADELGWFVFNARPDCPESMAVGAPRE